MSITLTVRDETTAGNSYHETPLVFPAERITVRELIRERVYQEVNDFNVKRNDPVFHGLVQPTETERSLNGNQSEFRMKKKREIDWNEQFDKAVDAFEKNGFFILINDTQAESLEQEFDITPQTEVSFVKLTLLVGG